MSNLFDRLSELENCIARSDDPRTTSLFCVGAVIAMALKAGWTQSELGALDALRELVATADRSAGGRN